MDGTVPAKELEIAKLELQNAGTRVTPRNDTNTMIHVTQPVYDVDLVRSGDLL